MHKDLKYLGSKLVILSIMGILPNIYVGSYISQKGFEENNMRNNIVSILPSNTPTWLQSAREDRESRCRLLGICDT